MLMISFRLQNRSMPKFQFKVGKWERKKESSSFWRREFFGSVRFRWNKNSST